MSVSVNKSISELVGKMGQPIEDMAKSFDRNSKSLKMPLYALLDMADLCAEDVFVRNAKRESVLPGAGTFDSSFWPLEERQALERLLEEMPEYEDWLKNEGREALLLSRLFPCNTKEASKFIQEAYISLHEPSCSNPSPGG